MQSLRNVAHTVPMPQFLYELWKRQSCFCLSPLRTLTKLETRIYQLGQEDIPWLKGQEVLLTEAAKNGGYTNRLSDVV